MHAPATVEIEGKLEVRINQFLPSETQHLFNRPEFFRLHSSSPRDTFAQLVRRTDSEVLATFACFYVGDGEYACPKRGTFGGVSARSGIDSAEVERLLQVVLDRIRADGARALRVKCPPWSHDPALSAITANFLMRAGATLDAYDLNYDLRVDARPFVTRIDAGNRKRIRKCLEEGFVAADVDLAETSQVYDVIRGNRERRGHPITMSKDQLDAMSQAFPGQVRYFAVYDDASRSRVIAGAVCMMVSTEVFYVFYWGDGPQMSAHSPVALLASHLYDHCQRNGFAILDAGISTAGGIPNHGLMRFKRGLGFTESLKPGYFIPL